MYTWGYFASCILIVGIIWTSFNENVALNVIAGFMVGVGLPLLWKSILEMDDE